MGEKLKTLFDYVKAEKGSYYEMQLAIFLGISSSRVDQTPDTEELLDKAQKMVVDVFKLDKIPQ
ncbi:hypothetical protein NEF87_004936 [Candidatus Lokiarchaeum ossiferum]|uniref:Uncharacterized protein n=1 Tax=Candidatus Lokiarchaeum ossiferum TaxID=2951803 RepID=A0ABY6HZ81_9ARCH|nr:hypothetical protein NEF87_004936 [Candidatus Lokiarchaeum sp. B-35]